MFFWTTTGVKRTCGRVVFVTSLWQNDVLENSPNNRRRKQKAQQIHQFKSRLQKQTLYNDFWMNDADTQETSLSKRKPFENLLYSSKGIHCGNGDVCKERFMFPPNGQRSCGFRMSTTGNPFCSRNCKKDSRRTTDKEDRSTILKKVLKKNNGYWSSGVESCWSVWLRRDML